MQFVGSKVYLKVGNIAQLVIAARSSTLRTHHSLLGKNEISTANLVHITLKSTEPQLNEKSESSALSLTVTTEQDMSVKKPRSKISL